MSTEAETPVVAAAETNGAPVGPEPNAIPAASASLKEEEREVDTPSMEGEEDVDKDDLDEGEEALFSTLEKEQEAMEAEEALHPHAAPTGVEAAPKLLQKALVEGAVKDDDEANASASEATANGSAAAAAPVASAENGTAASPERDPHYLQRAGNQLDFLLSRASEYSKFIAKDLNDLQNDMAVQAKAKLEKAEKKAKKRKAGADGKPGKSKKAKAGSKALETALAKDAAVRAGSKPIFVQPANLAAGCVLKDYQLEGVRWLVSLYENGVSGILADEMGLGKTIQCVALIAHLLTMGVAGPYLIVAPLATLPNWVREFEKWLPSHPVIRYHGAGPDRDAMLKGPLNAKLKRNMDFPFIVTSYEVAIRDKSKLEKLGEFTYVIVDEGHRLKNHRCTLLTSLKKLRAANRLLLSGTPIQNTLNELWSLLNFVNPSIFDDLNVFQSWFGFKDIGQKKFGATDEESILIEQRKNQTISKLHDILRPFLLRRVKSDVLSEMPPKKEIVVYSGISSLQAGYADMIDRGVIREELLAQGLDSARNLSQNNKMMNHRKNINHPFLFGEPYHPSGQPLGTVHPNLLVRASGKFALLDRMLSRLHTDGHQVLIFSQMTSVLNIMEDYLNFRKWKYCRIDGTTNIDDRQKQMDVFNAETTAGVDGTRNMGDDRHFVFLLSTRAGGLGINLTAADTCIIFDSDWNPFSDAQAMDRCHRMGQTRPVAVYRLLTVNSVDIEMMEKQVSKKKLERMTIAGGDFRKAGRRSDGSKQITFDHLKNLLQSDIKDLNTKGTDDVENVKISDEEFECIMDRKRLFGSGDDVIPSEGRMYDVIDPSGGDLLGSMKT